MQVYYKVKTRIEQKITKVTKSFKQYAPELQFVIFVTIR